jgi:hypothetical protein
MLCYLRRQCYERRKQKLENEGYSIPLKDHRFLKYTGIDYYILIFGNRSSNLSVTVNNITPCIFFQPGFQPFPLHLTERTSPSYIYNREGARGKGKQDVAVPGNPLRILVIEYPLWDENLTPLYNSSSITGFTSQEPRKQTDNQTTKEAEVPSAKARSHQPHTQHPAHAWASLLFTWSRWTPQPVPSYPRR